MSRPRSRGPSPPTQGPVPDPRGASPSRETPSARTRRLPFRKRRASSEGERAEPGVPIGPLLTRLTEELRNERSEILDPLLHRFADLGYRLRKGRDVPLEMLEEALSLLGEYNLLLHDVHIRQFAEAGPSDTHPEVCFLPMAQVEQEPERAERRMAAIRAMLSGYREGFLGYREILGLDLRNEALAELAWEDFSEDYAKTCLPSHLSAEGARAWELAMREAKEAFVELNRKVSDFLSRSAQLVLDDSPGAKPYSAPSVPTA